MSRRAAGPRIAAFGLALALASCGGKGDAPAPKDTGKDSGATPAATPTAATPPPATPTPTPAAESPAEALVREGKVKFAMGELAASLELMKRALAIDPEHPEAKLYASRAETELAKVAEAPATPAPTAATPSTASAEDQKKSIPTLLSEAAALVKAEKFAAPPGDNALEKYRAVLGREPLNREVQAQIAQAIASAKAAARAQLASGNTSRALEYLTQAKTMAPSDAEVATLLAEAQAQLSGASAPTPTPAPAPTATAAPTSPPPSPSPVPTASSSPAATPGTAVPTATAAPAATPAPATTPAPTAPPAEVTPTAPPTPTPPPIVDGMRAAWLEKKTPAVYPRAAWDAGQEGTSQLKVLVTVDGAVGEVMVIKSSSHAELDKAAVDAARKYVFKPAIENNKAIAQWVTVEVVFDKP